MIGALFILLDRLRRVALRDFLYMAHGTFGE